MGNAELFARREAAIPRALTHATQKYAHHARNAEIWDVEGTRFIDSPAALRCSTPATATQG